ncbi:hypothetical protein EXU48_23760 [Occultella glacieicola]|uniref:Uncharacterized protein n=1 Tax=Occultella glacieicola TaxID=2518684 RepID=A0ABY2DZR9_9MICO|nr:hypothetical protein [Occultella glacieicola]TDE88143.1 hypothetical protein EXU48_23760 [Occultella glacieicola]
MDNDQLPSAIESQIQSLLDKRVEAVRELVRRSQNVTNAEANLTAARSEHRKAWMQAIQRGWTEAELRKVGLSRPTAARTRRTSKTDSGQSETSNPEH